MSIEMDGKGKAFCSERSLKDARTTFSMQVTNRANLSSEQLAQIESEFGAHRTLTEILNWGLRQPAGSVHPQIISDVIVQDEYSHDVIVPWRDGLVVVYGTT
jgi:hypothetical protein